MKKTTYILLIVAMVFLQNCKPEPCQDPTNPECENYDPCYNAREVKAEIKIYNPPFGYAADLHPMWENEDIAVVGDSVGTAIIVFEALDLGPGAIYTWTLGEETINQRTFSRTQFSQGAEIEISLKVTAPTNPQCFPNDNGVDSLHRIFYTFEPGNVKPRYLGDFKGALNSSPNDSFVVSVVFENFQTKILNILENGCEFWPSDIGRKAVHSAYFKMLAPFAHRIPSTQTSCGSRNLFYLENRNDVFKLIMLNENNDTLIFNGYKIN